MGKNSERLMIGLQEDNNPATVSFYQQMEINSDCSLLPYDHYWISSKRIVTPQGVITGAGIS